MNNTNYCWPEKFKLTNSPWWFLHQQIVAVVQLYLGSRHFKFTSQLTFYFTTICFLATSDEAVAHWYNFLALPLAHSHFKKPSWRCVGRRCHWRWNRSFPAKTSTAIILLSPFLSTYRESIRRSSKVRLIRSGRPLNVGACYQCDFLLLVTARLPHNKSRRGPALGRCHFRLETRTYQINPWATRMHFLANWTKILEHSPLRSLWLMSWSNPYT